MPVTGLRRFSQIAARLFLIIFLIGLVLVSALTLLDLVLTTPMKRADSARELRRTLADLPDAESKWKAHPYANYDLAVSMHIHPMCSAQRVVHVRHGVMVWSDSLPWTFGDFDKEICNPEKWLPGLGFKTLRDQLDGFRTNDYTLAVSFDYQYGFVSKYSILGINNTGAFSFVATHFTPIDP